MPVTQKLVNLVDPNNSNNVLCPYTIGSAVICTDGNGNDKTLQAYIDDIEAYQGGGGGGGSTVTATDVTLSTSYQTFVTVNGISYRIKLPASNPWGGGGGGGSTVSYSGYGWMSGDAAVAGQLTIDGTPKTITIGSARAVSGSPYNSGIMRPYYELDASEWPDTISTLPENMNATTANFGQLNSDADPLYLVPIVTVYKYNNNEKISEAIPCIPVTSEMFSALTKAGVILESIPVTPKRKPK